jgi:hypothetical protein
MPVAPLIPIVIIALGLTGRVSSSSSCSRLFLSPSSPGRRCASNYRSSKYNFGATRRRSGAAWSSPAPLILAGTRIGLDVTGMMAERFSLKASPVAVGIFGRMQSDMVFACAAVILEALALLAAMQTVENG